MSNGWKSGSVAQVFSGQLQNKFPREQIRVRFYLLLFTFIQISVFSC
jgi:hypothetical protein